MYVKQSQLKYSLSHYFVWIGKESLFKTDTVYILRLRVEMADIKYLDHVRNELIALGCIMYCILKTLVIKIY